MQLTELPNETLLQIYHSLPTISSCHALASTSHHLHSLLHSSHRLPILFSAASTQYGPLPDAIRLITHTTTNPTPNPPLTLPLLHQILSVGRTATAWIALYPSQKWHGDHCASRRFLTPTEQFALRRACYRLWLYSLRFHNPSHPRTSRRSPPVVRARAALLRPWPTAELAELLDLQAIFRRVLQRAICPSNGTVLRRHRARFPDDPFPLVAVTHPRKWALEHAAQLQAGFHYSSSGTGSQQQQRRFGARKNPNASSSSYGITHEGWGDEIAHYYVIEDMLKLDPAQLLYLYEQVAHAGVDDDLDVVGDGSGAGGGGGGGWVLNAGWSSKGMVEGFLEAGAGGEWFENNGETVGETVGFVVGERGGDWGEVREGVEEGVGGWGVCAV